MDKVRIAEVDEKHKGKDLARDGRRTKCFIRSHWWPVLPFLFFLGTLCPQVQAIESGHSSGEVLATQVRKILGMKPGKHPYLPQYRKIIRFMHPRINLLEKDNAEQQEIALAPVKRAIHSLVSNLNAGADVMMLRNKILSSLTLDDYYMPSKAGSPWAYGKLWDRIILSDYLTSRARQMFKAGEKIRAAKYARAGLLLRCQDDVDLQGPGLLGYWFNPASPDARYNAIVRQNAITLGMSHLQKANLLKIYLSAVQYEFHIQSVKRAFWVNHFTIAKLWFSPTIPKRLVKRYAAALASRIRRNTGRLYVEFPTLRLTMYDVRAMIGHGHRNAAKPIQAVLKNLAGRIKKQRDISAIDRQALLRWIKEAQGRW